MHEYRLHRIRIGIIQIECHPHFLIGGRDYSAEPFIPKNTPICLARLQEHSFHVSDLQKLCAEKYLQWNLLRIASVLRWMEDHFADDPNQMPDVLVFPEGSIPPMFLPALSSFAQRHKVVIFAGTHTFSAPPGTKSAYEG